MPTAKKYSLIGYSYGASGNILGCRLGPDVLRQRGLIERIEALGHSITEIGNVTPVDDEEATSSTLEQASDVEKTINNFSSAYQSCKQLRDKVEEALTNGTTPLVMGGDHSLSAGSVAGVSNFYAKKSEKVGLIWIDTHPDINTPETSPSNNIFGMPIAFLLGLIPGVMGKLYASQQAIDPKNIVYIGLRDVDEGERARIKDLGITAYSMKEIDIHGLASVCHQAIDIASKGTAGFISSFDLDVCEPRLVPGTGTPMRGGLTYREAHLVNELIWDSGSCISLEIVELNPLLDQNFETADMAISLIESMVGKSIL